MRDFSVFVRGKSHDRRATFIAESEKAKLWTRTEVFDYTEGGGVVLFHMVEHNNIVEKIEHLRSVHNFEVSVR